MRDLLKAQSFDAVDAGNDPRRLDTSADHDAYQAPPDLSGFPVIEKKGSGKSAIFKRTPVRMLLACLPLLPTAMPAASQQLPSVYVNHLTHVLARDDLTALAESDFLRNELAVVKVTRSGNGDQASPPMVYLDGPSFSLEFGASAAADEQRGISMLAFSVDRIGELKVLQAHFDSIGHTMRSTKEREVDGVKVPWFDAMFVIDPILAQEPRFGFWVMEYKAEYFKSKGMQVVDDRVTRESYLAKDEPNRKGKILKKFTGLVLRLDDPEKTYLSGFLSQLGCEHASDDEFVMPDGFRIRVEERLPGDRETVESIEFETSRTFAAAREIDLSSRMIVTLDGQKGRIVFK